MRTCSIRARISSTPLFDAASSSKILNEALLLKLTHDSHSLHASISGVGCKQLIVLAMIRAQVVLPTPVGPQKRKACARVLFLMAFCRVEVMACCPTTLWNVAGLYLRADTMKFSICTQLFIQLVKVQTFSQ